MDKRYLLTLMKLPKVGRSTVKRIIDAMEYSPKSLKELHNLLEITKQKNTKLIVPTMEQLEKAYSTAEEILLRANNSCISVMGYNDSDFPKRLRNIVNPPVILYAKGNVDCLNQEDSVAVIGTRQPTRYGKLMAERLGKIIGGKGLVVVSGLAIGCDTAAHEGCLKAKGKTVAVLPNGLDTVYPKQNSFLAEQILNNSGCLLSEYPPGVKIMNNYFIERDRLQSGLCNAVIVVETDIKSGTMHTVKFAIEQKRALACIEHPEKFRTNESNGNIKLISEGQAIPLNKLKDIKVFLNTIANISKSFHLNSIEDRLNEDNMQLKIFD